MRKTKFQRKSSLNIHLWSGDYIVMKLLQRDIARYSHLLTGRLLDLGCGNSPYQPLFHNVSEYITYDIDTINSIDIVGTADVLPFHTESFNSILCTQVLEHTSNPCQVISEITRVLKPGGKLLISVPQSWRLHEEPYDFYRYTKYGISHLIQHSNLEISYILPQGGVWALIGQTFNNIIWRNKKNKFSLSWFIANLCSLGINITSLLVDYYFYDPNDTLNYVVLAQKSHNIYRK